MVAGHDLGADHQVEFVDQPLGQQVGPQCLAAEVKAAPNRVATDGAATGAGVSVTASSATTSSTRWSSPGCQGRVGSLPWISSKASATQPWSS
jgi:hypothetical protein